MVAGHEDERGHISQALRDATAQLLGKVKTELGGLRATIGPHHAARVDQALAMIDTGIRNLRGHGTAAVPSDPALETSPVTSRERQVLTRVAAGLTSKEIAGQLGISPRTVETHRESLMRKLCVTSVAGLTRYAMQHGITDDE
jgi:DNA-binding NarL/FixJ family response regulator